MGIKRVPLQNAIQKQLDATLSAGATSLTLNEDISSLITNVSATNPGVVVIDRVDSSGNLTASKREYITFTGVSTATLTGLTRNADGSGSDQEHAVGAIVEFVPDVLWAKSIQDTFEAEHGADGTHSTTYVVTPTGTQTLTNKTLTSPVLTTPQINDTSADHRYVIAVSELSADRTVTFPLLTGNDEFVFKDFIQTLTNKTLTSPTINTATISTPVIRSWDGWIDANETWTYASASTFTISGSDRTSVYTKGTRLKFTQTTTKYATVIGSSFGGGNTTVTIAVNTDYTLANAAISSPYYSYTANPQGYPVVFNYDSTIDGSGGSAGTFAATTFVSYFSIIGNVLYFSIYKDVTNKGSWSGNLRATIPVTTANEYQPINAVISNSGATNYLNSSAYGPAQVQNSSNLILFEKGIGTNNLQWSDLTATFRIVINGFCRF